MSESTCGLLIFEGQPIADLSNVFEDQGTWFADYRIRDGLPKDVVSFIQYSCDKLSKGTFDEKQLREFERYLKTEKWSVVGQGIGHTINGAPLFRTTDLSWVE